MANFHHSKVFNFEDPNLNAKIKDAEEWILHINQARRQVAMNLQDKKFYRDNAALQLKNWAYNNHYESRTYRERKEIEYLQQALDELYGSKKQRDIDICSEEEGINDLLLSKQIKSLRYRIQHGSNSLVAEKQILREMKDVEGKRGKTESTVDYCGSKIAIEGRIKILSKYLSTARKGEREYNANVKHGKEKLLAEAENEVRRVQEELENHNRIRDDAYDNIFQLKRQSDDLN